MADNETTRLAGDYVMLDGIDERCDCGAFMSAHEQVGDSDYACPAPERPAVSDAYRKQCEQANARSNDRCVLWVGAHVFVERDIVASLDGEDDDCVYFVYDAARVHIYEATTRIAHALAEAAFVERAIQRSNDLVFEAGDWLFSLDVE